MSPLEEQIIFEKLTGKCPIYYSEQIERSHHQASEDTQYETYDAAGCKIEPKQVEQEFGELDQYLRKMNSNRENYAFRHIYSCRAVLGHFIVFGKRVVRKCLKWYIEPICNQQTEFNNAATPAIGHLYQLQRTALDKLKKQQNEQRGMQEQLAQMQTSQTDIVHQIASLEEEKLKFQQQMNDIYQQLCEITKQQELRGQGRFAEEVVDDQAIKNSMAQSGEDMILMHILREKPIDMSQVSYLDLGANHAKFLSNTYCLYQKGARGVLVEANPALIAELKFYRSGDVILNRCVSNTSGKMVDFYVLNGDGLSTPDLAGAEAVIAENPSLKIERVVSVNTITVEEILNTYFDRTPTIVNLDIEGEEMKILSSIDFTKHRPLIMIIETIPYRKHLVVGLKNQEILDFMSEKNYIEYAFTGINSIFIDKEQVTEVLE